MRETACFTIAVVGSLVATTCSSSADNGKVVSNSVIYSAGGHNSLSDLVRFKDRWFCAFREGPAEFGPHAVVRVIASKDGKNWEKVAGLRAGFPRRGYQRPLFAIAPNGQLTLTTRGSAEKVTLQPQTWVSRNGRDWKGPIARSDTNFQISSVVSHKNHTYSFGTGCICGIAQTIQIQTTFDRTGKGFVPLFEQTFSGFFPGAGALVFDGEVGSCLLSRGSRNAAYLGRAKAPFDDWTWTEMKQPIASPRVIRTPDGRILVTTVLYDGRRRLSLCQFDPKTANLTELVELPAGAKVPSIGLAFHKGHAWVTYHAEAKGKMSVFLAKVLLAEK